MVAIIYPPNKIVYFYFSVVNFTNIKLIKYIYIITTTSKLSQNLSVFRVYKMYTCAITFILQKSKHVNWECPISHLYLEKKFTQMQFCLP